MAQVSASLIVKELYQHHNSSRTQDLLPFGEAVLVASVPSLGRTSRFRRREQSLSSRLSTLPAFDLGVGPSRCAADSTVRVYYLAFNISSFIIIITGQPALHVYRHIISYTLWETMKAMEQAFLPIIEANRKGNLKSGWIYLL